jgi:hypothetical protein
LRHQRDAWTVCGRFAGDRRELAPRRRRPFPADVRPEIRMPAHDAVFLPGEDAALFGAEAGRRWNTSGPIRRESLLSCPARRSPERCSGRSAA